MQKPPEDKEKVSRIEEARRRKEIKEENEAEAESLGKPTRLDNDMESADFYCAEVHREVKHVDKSSKDGWMWFNGKHWEIDTTRYFERAKEVSKKLVTRAAALPATSRKDFRKWAFEGRNLHRLKSMVNYAKSDPRISDSIENFDLDPLLMVTGNGVLDLTNGELQQFSSAQKVTKATSVNFNPNADQSKWLNFLDVVLQGDKDLESFVKRSVGYSMTGLMGEERFWFLYGPARTGKTTFLKCITTALGTYASYCPNTVWMKGYSQDQLNSLARYKGVRFVWVGELEARDRIDEPKLKGWVGGDFVTARLLFCEPFEFLPLGKLWLGGNHLPKVSADDSVFSKMFVVPFDNTNIIKTLMDKHLKDDLLDNHLEGVLAWCYEGYEEFCKEGLGKIPERVKKATATYREEVDLVSAFINEHCITGDAFSEGSTKLFLAFKKYVEDQGQHAGSQTQFGRELRKLGFESAKKKTVRYMNIALRNVEETEQY